MIDAFKRASAGRITAVMPYYAYGRTDKKDQPRVPITARLLADMIADRRRRPRPDDRPARRPDPGLLQHPGRRADGRGPSLRRLLPTACGCSTVVVAADLGSAKRARNFADVIGAPLAHGREAARRQRRAAARCSNLIGDGRGRPAIIVDDEIDTAGSICQAAETVSTRRDRRLRAADPRVLSGTAIERLRQRAVEEIVITDTIPCRRQAARQHHRAVGRLC